MTKSRSAPWLILALFTPAAPAFAETGDVEALFAAQRATLRAALRPGCPRPGNSDEIVVCVQRDDDRYRVAPGPVEAGSRGAERAGGAQLSAMEVNDADRCSPVGRHQQCGHVDFLGMGLMIAREIAAGIERRQD